MLSQLYATIPSFLVLLLLLLPRSISISKRNDINMTNSLSTCIVVVVVSVFVTCAESLQEVGGNSPTMEPTTQQGRTNDTQDTYTVILKNGESFTAVCPWTYGEFLAVDLTPYKSELETACLGKNFSSIDDCDLCLSQYLYYFEEVENASRNTSNRDAAYEGVMSWMPDFSILPLIDFTQGCPWAAACKQEMHVNVQASLGNELADTIYEMLSECDGGQYPGPEYNKSWQVVQNEFLKSGITFD